jgi:hypothetical protein
MSRFRHPHLVRGFIYTSKGAFAVVRGIIEAPDAVGESFGWVRVDDSRPPAAANPHQNQSIGSVPPA